MTIGRVSDTVVVKQKLRAPGVEIRPGKQTPSGHDNALDPLQILLYLDEDPHYPNNDSNETLVVIFSIPVLV